MVQIHPKQRFLNTCWKESNHNFDNHIKSTYFFSTLKKLIFFRTADAQPGRRGP